MFYNTKHYHLVVVGGGLSGVACAVSAAREGLKVLLIEKSGCLGGAIANNLIYPFMKYWEYDAEHEQLHLLSSGIFTEMRKTANLFEEETGLATFKPESFKRALDKMVLDAGVDVLFHATVYNAQTQNDKVISVQALTKSGKLTFSADFFTDATGDGELIEFTHCDLQKGRESDGQCQPMTTCFRMSGVDFDILDQDYLILQEKYKRARELGKIKNPRENILTMRGICDGILHLNTTRVIGLDPTDAFDLSKAEILGREQVYEMVEFLKENSDAFKNAAVISIANEIGVRESRKLKGLHVLTAEELKACTQFEDGIAVGNYEIDIHNPSGTGTFLYYFKPGEKYTIPYRSLVPKEYTNLLVAGRCLSATHEAHSAVRIMPICACLGQAAGTAIAIAHQTNATTHSVDTQLIRKKLKENGAYVI